MLKHFWDNSQIKIYAPPQKKKKKWGGGYDSFNQMDSNGCISPQHFFWQEGLKTIFCGKSAN